MFLSQQFPWEIVRVNLFLIVPTNLYILQKRSLPPLNCPLLGRRCLTLINTISQRRESFLKFSKFTCVVLKNLGSYFEFPMLHLIATLMTRYTNFSPTTVDKKLIQAPIELISLKYMNLSTPVPAPDQFQCNRGLGPHQKIYFLNNQGILN